MPTAAVAISETAILGPMPSGEQFFKLGIMFSTGQTFPTNMVSAHKWFNIAAMTGYKEAGRLRNEIAAEMSAAEIVTAQRAARDWVARH
jgi:TPR repeat protein